MTIHGLGCSTRSASSCLPLYLRSWDRFWVKNLEKKNPSPHTQLRQKDDRGYFSWIFHLHSASVSFFFLKTYLVLFTCACVCVYLCEHTHRCAVNASVLDTQVCRCLWWGRVVPPCGWSSETVVNLQVWVLGKKRGQRQLISIANLDLFQGNPQAVTPARQVLYY